MIQKKSFFLVFTAFCTTKLMSIDVNNFPTFHGAFPGQIVRRFPGKSRWMLDKQKPTQMHRKTFLSMSHSHSTTDRVKAWRAFPIFPTTTTLCLWKYLYSLISHLKEFRRENSSVLRNRSICSGRGFFRYRAWSLLLASIVVILNENWFSNRQVSNNMK